MKVLSFIAVTFLALTGCRPAEERAHPPQLEFRMALEMTPESGIWEISNLFRQEIEKASPEDSIAAGEIKVDFYDRGAVGSERELLEDCYFGSIELVQVNTALIANMEPAYGLLNLPYLFTSKEHHERVLSGAVGQQLLALIARDHLRGLGMYSTGFRNIFYKFPDGKPCASTRAEFRGLKIRVMESPIMINSINAMGASATPIPFSELYESLKTGVVDGAENSAKVFDSYDYEDTGCNCFTLTEHSTDQHILVANDAWFQSLKPKYQKRLLDVAERIRAPYDSSWDATTRHALQSIRDKHVQVNDLTDREAFIKAVRGVHQQFFALYPGVPRALYDEILHTQTR